MSDQKREFFRILYPQTYQASFRIGQENLAIIDISSRGIRLAYGKVVSEDTLGLEKVVSGEVYFKTGDKAFVKGTVHRKTPDFWVLLLNDPLPLKTMFDEHRLIVQKFDLN